jgi:hypothetical protein
MLLVAVVSSRRVEGKKLPQSLFVREVELFFHLCPTSSCSVIW